MPWRKHRDARPEPIKYRRSQQRAAARHGILFCNWERRFLTGSGKLRRRNQRRSFSESHTMAKAQGRAPRADKISALPAMSCLSQTTTKYQLLLQAGPLSRNIRFDNFKKRPRSDFKGRRTSPFHAFGGLGNNLCGVPISVVKKSGFSCAGSHTTPCFIVALRNM